LRAGTRSPLAVHAAARSTPTCQAAEAAPINPLPTRAGPKTAPTQLAERSIPVLQASLGGRPLAIVGKLNERAGDARVRELVDWAFPIVQRHFQDVLDGSLKLAADEDPNQTED
jgi:hypothetical protein